MIRLKAKLILLRYLIIQISRQVIYRDCIRPPTCLPIRQASQRNMNIMTPYGVCILF